VDGAHKDNPKTTFVTAWWHLRAGQLESLCVSENIL